jgi:thioredoxin reductase (NADPH)
MSDREVYELLIIGAGPAGLAAACAAQDAGLSYIVIERNGIVQSLVEHPQQIRYFSPADEIAIAGIPFPVAGGHKPTREDTLAYFRAVAGSRHLNLALWEEVISAEPMNVSDLIDRDEAPPRWSFAGPAEAIFAAGGEGGTMPDAVDPEAPIESGALENLPPDTIDVPPDDERSDIAEAGFAAGTMGNVVVSRPLPGFRVHSQKWNTGQQIERFCRYLLVCTGTFQNPRRLDIPGAELPKVHVRLEEPTPYFGCDVLVVGGGNSAATAAMTLAEAGARVTLAMRRPPADFQSHLRPFIVRDLLIMAEEHRLTLITGVRVTSILPDRVTLARVEYGAEADSVAADIVLPNDFVFTHVGHTADKRLFHSLGLPLTPDGLPVYDDDTAETPVPGIYVAGSLSRANIILESRRRAVEIVERIKAEIVASMGEL